MLKRIWHSGDQHIFFSKKFEAHQYVFTEFYKKIEERKPELIVLTGDLIDSKTKISPEQFTLARNFLQNITNYCPVIIILGNHDVNLQNIDRLDSISPIVHSLYNETINPIHFFKNSGEYNLYDINWAVWSCFDFQKKPEISGDNYTIGLYHGTVKNCISDNGFKLTEGIDIEEFKECNTVMLGDIHLKQTFRNNEIVYSGSLIQTKISESENGSFVEWDFNSDSKKYEPTFIELKNIYSIKTINIEDIKEISEISKEKLLVIKYDKELQSKSELSSIRKELANKGIKNIEFKAKTIAKKKNIIKSVEDKKLILSNALDSYLEYRKNTSEEIKKIKDLDSHYSSILELTKEFEYGDFTIKEIRVNNFLGFKDKETVISLDKDGVIGISGKNKVGKSSLINSIAFALFSSSRSSSSSLKKMINKNNRNKECYVALIIEKAGKLYIVKRTIIPKKKEGISIQLDFKEIDSEYNEINSLNGEQRKETEKEIVKYFGLESSFEIMSFYSAQKKQVEFIDCKNSERLSLINKFLGLQYFELKEKLVSEDIKIEKEVISLLSKELDKYTNLENLKSSKKEKEDNLTLKEEELKELELELNLFTYKNRHLQLNYELNKKKSEEFIENISLKEEVLFEEKKTLSSKKIEKENSLSQLKSSLIFIDIKEINGKIDLTKKEILELEKEIAIFLNKVSELEKQLLKEKCNNCNKEYTLTDKEKTKENLKNLASDLSEKELKNNLLKETLVKLKEEKNIFLNSSEEIDDLNKELELIELKLEKNESENKNLVLIKEKIKEIEIARENLIKLEKEYSNFKIDLKLFTETKLYLEKDITLSKEELNRIKRDILLVEEVESKLKTSDNRIKGLRLYKETIYKDALPLYILQSKLGEINNQINSILSNIFNFEIEFKIDIESGELNIEFFYEDDREDSDVCFASGAETFIINLCIKIGLAQISELPKITSILIDEGYGTLDKENLDKIPELFEILPKYYKNIITVSHIEELKNLYTHNIFLDKVNGYTEVL